MTVIAPQINIAADVRRAKRALARMGQSLNDGQMAAAVGLKFERIIDDNFRKEGNDQGPWERLTVATIERRADEGDGSFRILQDKGRLKAATESARTTNTEVRIGPGNNVVYAATHQHGDPSRGIPARPFLPSKEFAESEARRLIDSFIALKKRQSGF